MKPKCLFINFVVFALSMQFLSCTHSPKFTDTVKQVDIEKFMGRWYVMGGRFTVFEKNVFNGVEVYQYNKEKKQIDIGFTYNQGAFDGPVKSLPQKGRVYNKLTNSHWKVTPLWPLEFDYLIIGLADDYSWTVIGVPDQSYVWIMARNPHLKKADYDSIVNAMKSKNYNMDNLVEVKHQP